MLEQLPPTGLNVYTTLADGRVIVAYIDEHQQWWTGIPDEPKDLPLANNYVVSWTPIT